jgi:hypothetical protein
MVVERIQAGGGGIRADAKNFSFLKKRPVWCGDQLNSNRHQSSRVKRPGREARHSNPPSGELRNERTCNSNTPACQHGADRDQFQYPCMPTWRGQGPIYLHLHPVYVL